MQTLLFKLLRISVIMGVLVAPAGARGRKPDNSYPDYNKLEFHPKKDAAADPAQGPNVPGAVLPPTNTPPVPREDDAPLPPPKPVFMPDDSSEPPMPDDITNTLLKSTTTQP